MGSRPRGVKLVMSKAVTAAKHSGMLAPQVGGLLTVDSGKRLFGAAKWVDGVLQWAALFNRDLPGLLIDRAAPVDLLVLERMVVGGVGSSRRRGDPADLIAVSESSGFLRGIFQAPAIWRTANQWKGSLPKEETERRTRDALSPHEFGRVELPESLKGRSDVWDAVSIGLHELRRLPWWRGHVSIT